MSNIKTRKGLAFGALVALGASLIAGAPAHAAGELNVAPTGGTLLSTLSTESFNLVTNFTGTNATTATEAGLSYQIKSTSDLNIFSNTVATDNLARVHDVVVVSAHAAGSAFGNTLELAPVDATKAATAEVTTFVDSNGNSKLDAGEWTDVKTISWKTLASVASAVVFDAPHAGDTSVTGQVTLEGINLTQIQSTVSINASSYNSVANVRHYTTIGSGSAAVDTLKFDVAVSPALVADANLSVRASLPGSANFAETLQKVAPHTIATITAAVDKGANALASGFVRANSAYTVTSVVKDSAVPAVAVKGAAVVAEVTAGSHPALNATDKVTVTINGTTYTSNADLAAAAIKLTSDADGKATINVTTTGFVAGNTLTFRFTSEHFSASTTSTVQALHYTVVDTADKLDVDARSAVAGSTVTVAYSVNDQFGQPAADGLFAVLLSGSGITADHANVVGGVANVSVKVAATPAVANFWVTPTLYAYGTETTFVNAEEANNATNEDGFNLYVAPTAEITAATISLTKVTADGDYVLDSAATFGNVDGRFATPITLDGTAVSFTGTVKAGDVATHTIAGASVTISAPGLEIVSGNQQGLGTLTIPADNAGNFAFVVYSHTSGAQTVTVTSGAATASKVATAWVAGSIANVAASVASASYTTGRAVTVEFTATDKYGNAASTLTNAATVTVAGQGYLVAGNSTIGSSVVVTFTGGKASVQLVDGADQIGTSTVTLSTKVGDATKTAASTYTFGQTDANLNISGKRVTADWVFAAGKTVTITRDGVTIRTFHPTANSADSFSFNLKKSKKSHRVTIKVNGVTITDAGYLVK